MVYGAISEEGEEYYTYLPKIFDAIDNAQLNYNWLITDCFCNFEIPVVTEVNKNGYCWISGEDLTKLVQNTHVQWIWAVLSGFPKDVPLSEVLKHPLPFADGYGGFWRNPISIQHPLATIEIVPWDSSSTLFFSTDKALVEKFKAGYPQSEDLSTYIARHEKQQEA